MTTPNPFNTGSDLKGVMDAAAEIMGGQPVLPDEFGSHVDAAAEELGKIDGPASNEDITKIIQKHFNDASKGQPQSTKLQTAFQTEIGKKVHQNRMAKKWSEG